MDEEHINVWPAFTDLVSGILLTVFIFFAVLLASGTPEEKEQLERELTEAKARIAALESENKALSDELASARETVGVNRKFLDALRRRIPPEFKPTINESGNLEISSELLFKLDQRDVPKDRIPMALKLGESILSVLAGVEGDLNRNVALVLVVGHADYLGEEEYNWALSWERARSLLRLWQKAYPSYFATTAQGTESRKCPVGAKILPAGFGTMRPKGERGSDYCENLPGERGCRADRRIEIRIVPKPSDARELPGCIE
jgi:outer membrane protein OmpA-like peptidoglycan-associated protein